MTRSTTYTRLRSRFSMMFLPATFVPALLLAALTFANVPDAEAGTCAVGQVREVGSWVNPDGDTRGITRAVFEEQCRDDTRRQCSGDICSITHGVKLVYTAKLWGSCLPRDCYWGEVEGTYTSGNWLRFRYDHGFAERMVWGQVWSGSDDWLRLIVDTDFDAPSREDYRFDEWMRRQ